MEPGGVISKVLLRASVHVLVCVLVCGIHCTAAEVTIRHNQNFSRGLVLTCFDGLFTPDSGVSFQRDSSDIPQEDDGGTLRYPLSQENEGNFTCTHNGQISDPITLAAVPPLDFPRNRFHDVLVPVTGTPLTQLMCDIGPGAARESYSIEWKRLYPVGFTRVTEGISPETFILTLTVDLGLNNAMYLCTVTIDHDGTGNSPTPYDGAIITFRATERVQDMTVTTGEQANFSCSAVGSEVDIKWTIGDTEYKSCPPLTGTGICFENSYMSDAATTKSTLIIADSSSLGVGSHRVQCIVQQYVGSDFQAEPFNESASAFLRVTVSESTAVSASVLSTIAVLVIPLAVLVSSSIPVTIYIKRKRAHRQPELQKLGESEVIKPEGGVKEDYCYEQLVREAIPRNSIRLLNIIGEGEFGLVYKAHLVKMNSGNPLHIIVATRTVAVKTIKGFHDQESSFALLDEARRMVNLDHPNILTLIGVCMDEHSTPCIVMPYMANGSLLAHLRTANNYVLVNSRDQRLVQDISRRLLGWCLQIAQGMEYLAAKRIIHRDLAARNCMLEENMVIRIADFGFSEKLYMKVYVRMVVDGAVKLPVKWMAPESINHGVFSEKSDVWSFGVTCWEIFTGGVTPYPGVHSSAIPKMRDHERIMDRPNNQACSEDLYGVMLDCWESAADDRPSFSQLVTVLTTHLETLAGGYLKITAV